MEMSGEFSNDTLLNYWAYLGNFSFGTIIHLQIDIQGGEGGEGVEGGKGEGGEGGEGGKGEGGRGEGGKGGEGGGRTDFTQKSSGSLLTFHERK